MGGVTAMTYSPNGYLTQVAYPDQTVEFSYDAAGNRIAWNQFAFVRTN